MSKQNKQDKLIAELREQITELNDEIESLFFRSEQRANRIDELEAEANDLFDESAAYENDRDYWKAIAEQSGAVADAALDQRDELTAALEATENRLAHAQDAIASLLLSI